MKGGVSGCVSYIATTDTGVFDLDENIVRVLDLRDRSVFESNSVDAIKDEGEVLCTRNIILAGGHGSSGATRKNF